jgi:ribonucleotide reductase alpha subunit
MSKKNQRKKKFVTIKPDGPPVSLTFGTTTSGIEPVFNNYYKRKKIMAKPNENQLKVLDYLSTQIEYWKKTNDISSPTHGGDMEEEFHLIEDIVGEEDKNMIMESLSDLLSTVRRIT